MLSEVDKKNLDSSNFPEWVGPGCEDRWVALQKWCEETGKLLGWQVWDLEGKAKGKRVKGFPESGISDSTVLKGYYDEIEECQAAVKKLIEKEGSK